MGVWVKLGFTALAAGAVYSAFRKPPPPPPDTAVSATEVKAMLKTVLAYSNRVCLDVPELPLGRFAKPGALATLLAPGERRPWLADLVAAGVVLHDPAEKVADHAEDFPRVETFRVAPAYKKDYEPGGLQKGHLCFATLEVESVQSVRRAAPGSGDHVVQFRYKVSDVSDWVRRLPADARGDTAAWVAAPTRPGTVVFCYDRPGAPIVFGTNCARQFVDEMPLRLLATGPQPRDDLGTWERWPFAPAASASGSSR